MLCVGALRDSSMIVSPEELGDAWVRPPRQHYIRRVELFWHRVVLVLERVRVVFVVRGVVLVLDHIVVHIEGGTHGGPELCEANSRREGVKVGSAVRQNYIIRAVVRWGCGTRV